MASPSSRSGGLFGRGSWPEVSRIAEILRAEHEAVAAPVAAAAPVTEVTLPPEVAAEPLLSAVPPLPEPVEAVAEEAAWPSYAPSGSVAPGETPNWS